ncbi:EAL domain-containing protein [Pseudomonas sp. ZM23]|uniref:EAL domain-containing protein n=1 Tax=Pseudomonas triclosanedens TaxID=2961893 RepID=A0ABY7A4P5_9PSED|nr:bifunctional diguanylate cyclase/phosphodiesterase [Pseudomonas triclosanedens]MCP8464337.1 EAL domain-containing protein [Pseudomonas triclosanedens]MCP8471471.1 EAL domain-containing protein [Pseudomonas triclosanedens]MCP8477720.1 EAL domain-containing protein [Pseudomonas triclosanedens]WAI51175.1 EAL domain-containing protein [Pseudomonas triclosanedens]
MDWQKDAVPDAVLLECTHSPGLVLLSILIACVASFVALGIANRVARTRRPSLRWQWIGGISLGSGIWSMHFVAMLAFRPAVPVHYSTGPTLLSLLIAIAASAFAMRLLSRAGLSPLQYLLAACCIGASIAGMHYAGMAAIQSPPMQHYDPFLVALSVLLAILVAYAALVLTPVVNRQSAERRWIYQIGASLLLGGAISGMHYTGMAALTLTLPNWVVPVRDAAQGNAIQLGLMVGLLALAVVLAGLWAAWIEESLESKESELHRVNTLLSQLDHANASLQQLARFDGLTGLHNRTALNDEFAIRLERNRQKGQGMAVILLDLDHFKRVNDSLGHAAGDELLCIVSGRIRSALRSSDLLARFGGDEFCILADLGEDHEARILAQRLMQRMKEPITTAGRSLVMTLSVGISLFPNDGVQAEELLKHADLALYQSKGNGRNVTHFFSPHLKTKATQELQLEEELRKALWDDELVLYYQPILRIDQGGVEQVEALVRWKHPVHGLLAPDRFIGLAVANGLIGALDAWVLRHACKDLRRLHELGFAELRMAVNCCASNLGRDSLVEEVQRTLEEAGLPPHFLELEVTENAVMANISQAIPLLNRLRELGVSLSVDDFGTGYSSLSYLRQLPLDALKVDRSFIRDVPQSRHDGEIAQAIIAMAQKLHLKVIAEGVEYPQQLAFLRDNHCELAQGYLFSRPLPFSALVEFLDAYREGTGSERLRSQA